MLNLRSKVARELLSFFFLHEEEGFYVNELARRLDLDKRNMAKKLTELEAEGLFQSTHSGNQKFYSLNREFPLYQEYRQFVLKTAGLEAQLREALRNIPGISQAYLYGSYASNRMDASSDIDLLVIGDHKVIEAQKAIAALQKKLDREINLISMSEEEFRAKANDPFLADIMRNDRLQLI